MFTSVWQAPAPLSSASERLGENLAKLTSAPQDAGSMELLHAARRLSSKYKRRRTAWRYAALRQPTRGLACYCLTASTLQNAAGLERMCSPAAAPTGGMLAPPVRAMCSMFADRVFGNAAQAGIHEYTRVSTAGIDPVAFFSSVSGFAVIVPG